jgi:hypothetical protein
VCGSGASVSSASQAIQKIDISAKEAASVFEKNKRVDFF